MLKGICEDREGIGGKRGMLVGVVQTPSSVSLSVIPTKEEQRQRWVGRVHQSMENVRARGAFSDVK